MLFSNFKCQQYNLELFVSILMIKSGLIQMLGYTSPISINITLVWDFFWLLMWFYFVRPVQKKSFYFYFLVTEICMRAL